MVVKGSDLVLTKALDKESVDGPSSFAVNVRCRRKRKQQSVVNKQRLPDISLKGIYAIYLHE